MEDQERIERAHAILDAAAKLILRWGYNKTTVDDIAKEAGVGKGTVYLHWKTRDALFEMLIRREQLVLSDDFQQRIANDPEGARLSNIYKHTMIATMQRPLLKAFMLGDSEVWGKLLEDAQSSEAYIQKMAGFKVYLELLQQHNLVRRDLPVEAQVTMLSSIIMGFFISSAVLPEAYQVSIEDMAELLGETVRRTFEPQDEITAAQLQKATTSFRDYIQHIDSLLRQQFQDDLEK